MALTLDDRHRAMLLEMGVRVWLPGTAFDTVPASVAPPQTVPGSAPARATAQPSSPVVAAPTEGTCQACSLYVDRLQAALQAAPAQWDWMVVGDPPEEDEERAGQAFVASPGLLLDNMLKAVGASRTGAGAQGAYATHVLKCRPPHGQIPQAADLAWCAQYLQREIALVRPKVILAMGRFAIQALLAEHGVLATQPLGKLRGTVYSYGGIPVIVTYHPKLLLRNSADKAKAWADLCLAMDVLERR